jgi:hypothetical protein
MTHAQHDSNKSHILKAIKFLGELNFRAYEKLLPLSTRKVRAKFKLNFVSPPSVFFSGAEISPLIQLQSIHASIRTLIAATANLF